ncbi:MAG: hypothetical protein ACE5FJ_00495 [Gemmatimonadales bacterium]
MTEAGLVLLLVAAVLLWLFVRPRRSDRSATAKPDDIDRNELAAAESELEDLRWDVTPEEADESIPDWGPGAPKG